MAKLRNPLEVIGSAGGIILTSIDGCTDLLQKGKEQLICEVNDLAYERKVNNALSRIKVKAEAIKEIMEMLNISAEEAESLLEKELKNE